MTAGGRASPFRGTLYARRALPICAAITGAKGGCGRAHSQPDEHIQDGNQGSRAPQRVGEAFRRLGGATGGKGPAVGATAQENTDMVRDEAVWMARCRGRC